jgi:hypothetical protein
VISCIKSERKRGVFGLNNVATKAAVFVLSLIALGACNAQDTVGLQERQLSDGSGKVIYDCRPLDGTDAANALSKAHALFEAKFYPQFRANRAQTKKLLSEKTLTQSDIAEINQKAKALEGRAAAETAALGCTFRELSLKHR